MNFKELVALSQEAFIALEKGAFLTTKGDGKNNTMTISWGTMGRIWEKPMMLVLVRESRYTHGLLEKNQEFTVTFPKGTTLNHALGIAGSQSGRDIDKFSELNLTIKEGKSISTPIIETEGVHLECKVVGRVPVGPEHLEKEIVEGFYSDQDFHTLYFGEVLQGYQL